MNFEGGASFSIHAVNMPRPDKHCRTQKGIGFQNRCSEGTEKRNCFIINPISCGYFVAHLPLPSVSKLAYPSHFS